VARQAIVYVPESVTGAGAVPLLLNFHGFGGTSGDHLEWADMRSIADANAFVLVYPQGTELDGSPHWNTSLPSADNKSSAEDFGFVEALIDTVAASYSVDDNRVYAIGYSNGGMFSFALACFRAERIAAIASISGAMLDDIGVDCTPPPTSVLTIHGTEDSVLPYDGGFMIRSAQDVIDYWTQLNGIDGEPATSTSTHDGNQIDTFRYTGGELGTEVHHHRVVGGGHVWIDIEVDGARTNELIWDFLSRHGRDGAL
jgi:polyhydroxybutyrate depolymerase